jgi:hypothetical protein
MNAINVFMHKNVPLDDDDDRNSSRRCPAGPGCSFPLALLECYVSRPSQTKTCRWDKEMGFLRSAAIGL